MEFKFPSYIPPEISQDLESKLYGSEKHHLSGYEEILAGAEESLSSMDQQIHSTDIGPENDEYSALCRKWAEAKEHRDTIEQEAICLKRLITDPRMHKVYSEIPSVLPSPADQINFIRSAWIAKNDYQKYRDRHKRVIEHKQKIGKTAQKLSSLLKQVEEIGYSFWPPEFFSIQKLLENTDYEGSRASNAQMWRGLRHLIMGNYRKKAPSENDEVENVQNNRLLPNQDPEGERRNSLRYAWEQAPDLSSLLDTVVKASEEFFPTEDDFIGSAIKSKKGSTVENKEFLRAYVHLLAERNIEISLNIKKMMVIIANAVLDDPDFVVGYDDVVKAIDSL